MGKPLRKIKARLAARRAFYREGQGFRKPGSQNRHKSFTKGRKK